MNIYVISEATPEYFCRAAVIPLCVILLPVFYDLPDGLLMQGA